MFTQDYVLVVRGLAKHLEDIKVSIVDVLFRCQDQECQCVIHVRLDGAEKKQDFQKHFTITNPYLKLHKFSFTVHGDFAPKASAVADDDVSYIGVLFTKQFPIQTTNGYWKMSDIVYAGIAPEQLLYQKPVDEEAVVKDYSTDEDVFSDDGESTFIKNIGENTGYFFIDSKIIQPYVRDLRVVLKPVDEFSGGSEASNDVDKVSLYGKLSPEGSVVQASFGGSEKSVALSKDGEKSGSEKSVALIKDAKKSRSSEKLETDASGRSEKSESELSGGFSPKSGNGKGVSEVDSDGTAAATSPGSFVSRFGKLDLNHEDTSSKHSGKTADGSDALFLGSGESTEIVAVAPSLGVLVEGSEGLVVEGSEGLGVGGSEATTKGSVISMDISVSGSSGASQGSVVSMDISMDGSSSGASQGSVVSMDISMDGSSGGTSQGSAILMDVSVTDGESVSVMGPAEEIGLGGAIQFGGGGGSDPGCVDSQFRCGEGQP